MFILSAYNLYMLSLTLLIYTPIIFSKYYLRIYSYITNNKVYYKGRNIKCYQMPANALFYGCVTECFLLLQKR